MPSLPLGPTMAALLSKSCSTSRTACSQHKKAKLRVVVPVTWLSHLAQFTNQATQGTCSANKALLNWVQVCSRQHSNNAAASLSLLHMPFHLHPLSLAAAIRKSFIRSKITSFLLHAKKTRLTHTAPLLPPLPLLTRPKLRFLKSVGPPG